jgi:hypothetical protein
MPETIKPDSEAANAAPSLIPPFMAFISYPHEDAFAASTLRDALISLDKDRIEVFFDESSITTGKNISQAIIAALGKSDWFIALGTDVVRQNFAWCGLELGMFMQDKLQKNTFDKCPIACLYTGTIPDLFHDRLQVKMVSLSPVHTSDLGSDIVPVEKSPIFKMLSDFAKGYRAYYNEASSDIVKDAHKEWAFKKAEIITDAYVVSLRSRIRNVWYPQKRIEISTSSVKFWEMPARAVPDDSDVTIDMPVYSLFRIGTPAGTTVGSMKWRAFNDLVSHEMGGPHLEFIINSVVCSVLPSRDEAINDHTFLAPNGTRYRVILTRHVLYRDGRRGFSINFIETLAVAQSGDSRTTMLVAAIMLASRFRFLFLENASEYSVDQVSRVDGEQMSIRLKKLLREWKKINMEAADHGLSDITAIKRLLPDHDDEVEELFSKWWAWVSDFEKSAARFIETPSPEARDAFVVTYSKVQAATDKVNRRFISLCLAAYERELGS